MVGHGLPAYYASNLEVGCFSVAVSLSSLIIILAAPISMALFPAFSKLNPASEISELKTCFKKAVFHKWKVPASVLYRPKMAY